MIPALYFAARFNTIKVTFGPEGFTEHPPEPWADDQYVPYRDIKMVTETEAPRSGGRGTPALKIDLHDSSSLKHLSPLYVRDPLATNNDASRLNSSGIWIRHW